jgi:hypothetical protein
MTLEGGVAVPVNIRPIGGGLDLSPGPGGKPIATYDRCTKRRCQFYTYDFATHQERALKGAPTGNWDNWAFWRDRFALVREGRLLMIPVGGKPRDIGRARSLGEKTIDFNGVGVAYVNVSEPEGDVEEYELVYWPLGGKGRYLMSVRHGLSGDVSLVHPFVSSTYAYATQPPGEYGGPSRLWRVPVRGGKRRYAPLPYDTVQALPVGAKRAIAAVCPNPEENDDVTCRLVMRPVTYR